MPLNQLGEYDKQSCLEMLEKTELSELWDAFLKGQTDLFFDEEAKLLESEARWQQTQTVLELGSGNGAYLARLADKFLEKNYLGMEKKVDFAKQAASQFGRPGLVFVQGDAEEENIEYIGQFDAVFFRFTLQHLANPYQTLELAHKYLNEDGALFIFDSYDPAGKGAHSIPLLRDAKQQLQEKKEKEQRGNRRITMETLQELANGKGPLSSLYQLTRTSLDVDGNRLERGIYLEGERSRKRFFNQILLFLTILQKDYGIPVDLAKAYEELQIYLTDETSWICPGVHFLVLKKVSIADRLM